MSTINKKINISNASALLNNPNIIILATKDKLILNDININLSDESKNLIASKIISGVEILGYHEVPEITTTVNIYDEVTNTPIITLTTTGNKPDITIHDGIKKLIVSSTQSAGTSWDFSDTDYKSIFLENEYYNLDTWQQILLTAGSSVNLWVSKNAAAVTTVDFVDSAEEPAPDKYGITSITTTQTNPVLESVRLTDGTIRVELSSTSVSLSHEYHCDMTNNKYHITVVDDQDYELPTNEPIQLQTGNTYKCYVTPKELEFTLISTNETHTLREDFTLNGIHNLKSDVTEILKDNVSHELTINSNEDRIDSLTIYGTYRQ